MTIQEVSLKKNRSDELNERLRSHRSKPSRQSNLKKAAARGTESLMVNHFERYKEEMLWLCEEVTRHPMFDSREVKQAVAFRTEILSLDRLLGNGIPAGVVEVYGEESVGKTTFAATLIQAAQGAGLETALCMSEFFDKPRFAKLGVCLDDLLFIKGRGEQVLGLGSEFISRSDRRLLVVDSLTNFRPEEDEFDAWAHMVLGWLRHTTPYIRTGSAVVVVNQVRARISKNPGKMFAGGTTSAARRVVGLFDARLELSRSAVTETTYDLVVNVVSNVLAPPARFIHLPVIKEKGIDVWRDLVRVASIVGTLTKRGSWYYVGSYQLGQGEESTARSLEENPNMTQYLLRQTLLKLGS